MSRNIRVLFIFIIINLCIPIYSQALSLDEILTGGNAFLSQGEAVKDTQVEGIQALSNSVSGILLSIAIIVTLISAVVMGISFTVQSVEDKAKIKESMIPWVIGIFISFGAFAIWQIIMSIFYNI